MDIIGLTDRRTTRVDHDHAAPPAIDDTSAAATPAIRRIADIPAQPLTWLWPGWIPAGTLTVLGGHVGDGKSTIISAIVAAFTTGACLPDGATAPVVNVLILSAEDDPARVIRPRLDANNADPDRVFILDTASPATHQRWPDLRRDAARLRDIIEAQDIRMLVIDPLGSFLRRSDRASEGDIRDALQPLMTIIADTGVTVLGAMRVGKASTARRPAQRLVGSSAVPAIARSVIMIASAHGEDTTPGSAVLQVVKSNYTRPPQAVALRMDDDGTVQWLGPASAGVDELAETATDRRLDSSERADAAAFLREYLAEGSVNAVAVLKQAKRLGFSEITIRRAKKDLGVTSYRDPHFRGFWMWRLPDTDAQFTQPDPHPSST